MLFILYKKKYNKKSKLSLNLRKKENNKNIKRN